VASFSHEDSRTWEFLVSEEASSAQPSSSEAAAGVVAQTCHSSALLEAD